jgi:hypothetical protein
MRGLGTVDLMAYVRAFGLYARNPSLAVAPLIAGLAGAALTMLTPGGTGPLGGLSNGLTGLVVSLLTSCGLAVSVIVADGAWRYGRSPFDTALDEARRKLGDILMAAIGFNFLLFVAGLLGGFLGGVGALVLTAVAAYFFIYTIPAAAIGGIPGGAALQVSIERVQRSYLATFVLGLVFVLFIVLFQLAWSEVVTALANLSPAFASLAARAIVGACVQAIGIGYLALVMAKAYNDASYGRRY